MRSDSSTTMLFVVNAVHLLPVPPAHVWSELTPLERLASWHPMVLCAQGSLTRGEKIDLKLLVAGERPTLLRPRVTSVRPASQIGLACATADGEQFSADYQLVIEEEDGGTRMTQLYRCSGTLRQSALKAVAERTRRLMERFGAEVERALGDATKDIAPS